MADYKHWKLNTDADGICWLHADRADSSTNTLSQAVLQELSAIVEKLHNEPPRGLIILSDKSGGFIAGADINELKNATDRDQARDFIRLGQGVFDRLEALRFPTVCLIHGFCMGGGTELALACRYRIANDDDDTRIGLPEVKLGIFPAFGGATRLPLLIGAPAAMGVMLTGSALSARAAKKLGMIDYAVPDRHLMKAAKELVLNPPPVQHLSGWKALTNHPVVRPFLAVLFRRQAAAKVRENHYPAPFALIDLWLKHGSNKAQMIKGEERAVSKLAIGDTCKNLIRVFFLQEALKAVGDKALIHPHRLHVVGAGVMGGDIAAWCALQGMTVTLQDRHEETIAKALKRAHKLYTKKLKKPYLVQGVMDRLIPDMGGLGIAKADIIIEAIIENKDAKQTLFKALESKVKADAILATNTSSIPLDSLSACLQDPTRLVGIHFFNPVAMMQLVEIIHAPNTNQKVIDQAAAFTRHISRLPLPVKSSPGFLVNRVLMPYLLEAVILESEGISAAVIDEVALDFGMPMGPIALADTVGLDICLSVAEILAEKLALEVPKRLRTLVEAGRLGMKSGHGFYVYKNGIALHSKASKSDYRPADIQDRLMLRMINEVIACQQEGIVAEDDLIDAGIIFATGFAPFTGGPLHYCESLGKDSLYQKLISLEERHGSRFKPATGWSGQPANSQPDAA